MFFIELKESFRSRWFLIYFVLFSGIVLGFVFAVRSELIYEFSGVGHFMASLINASIVFVPLFSLIPSSISISGSRENLSLEYILSFPIKKSSIFFSKFFSSFVSVVFPPVVSVIVSAFFLKVVRLEIFFVVLLLLILAFFFVSLGLFISVLTQQKSRSLAFALILWAVFTFGGELGLFGYISFAKIPNWEFLAFYFLNPIELFRVSAISLFSKSLDVLGPFGLYLYSKLGNLIFPISSSVILFLGILILTISYFIFTKQKV